MDTKTSLLEDLATSLDYWKRVGAECLTRHDADLIWTDNPDGFRRIAEVLSQSGISEIAVEKVLEEIIRGFCVSVLTMLDGGTALSESTALTLRDHLGQELTQLRQDFISHLFNTGRLA